MITRVRKELRDVKTAGFRSEIACGSLMSLLVSGHTSVTTEPSGNREIEWEWTIYPFLWGILGGAVKTERISGHVCNDREQDGT